MVLFNRGLFYCKEPVNIVLLSVPIHPFPLLTLEAARLSFPFASRLRFEHKNGCTPADNGDQARLKKTSRNEPT